LRTIQRGLPFGFPFGLFELRFECGDARGLLVGNFCLLVREPLKFLNLLGLLQEGPRLSFAGFNEPRGIVPMRVNKFQRGR
jgi:hypothetical protein